MKTRKPKTRPATGLKARSEPPPVTAESLLADIEALRVMVEALKADIARLKARPDPYPYPPRKPYTPLPIPLPDDREPYVWPSHPWERPARPLPEPYRLRGPYFGDNPPDYR